MFEESLWHPVAALNDLLGDGPHRVRLLSHDLVLWRDAASALRAFADRCPHRGTRFSLGRVHAGELECAYHGWRFEGSGRCVAIPAVPGFAPPASHTACAHEVCEAFGLAWVRLQPSDAALPTFAAEDDAHLRRLLCGPYGVATSAPRIVENFLDLSHFGFVHEGWLGDRAHTRIDAHRIAPMPHGFEALDCSAWQPQSNALSSEGSTVAYRYQLTAPFTALLEKLPQAQGGYRDVIGLFVCPVDPEHSRVWFRLAVTDFDSSDEALRAFQHTIFTQDQPVLESQVPKRLPLTDQVVREVHSAADRSSAAYRRFLRERGITFGVC